MGYNMNKMAIHEINTILGTIHIWEQNMLWPHLELLLECHNTKDLLNILQKVSFWKKQFSSETDLLNCNLADLHRHHLYNLLETFGSTRKLSDYFKITYDYHNLRVLLKEKALNAVSKDLYLESGRFSIAKLSDLCHSDDSMHY